MPTVRIQLPSPQTHDGDQYVVWGEGAFRLGKLQVAGQGMEKSNNGINFFRTKV